MKSADIVRNLMDDKGMSMEVMAGKLGYSNRSGVNNRLSNKKDMRVDVLVSFLEALDCELVVRSKLKDKKEWVISSEND